MSSRLLLIYLLDRHLLDISYQDLVDMLPFGEIPLHNCIVYGNAGAPPNGLLSKEELALLDSVRADRTSY